MHRQMKKSKKGRHDMSNLNTKYINENVDFSNVSQNSVYRGYAIRMVVQKKLKVKNSMYYYQ